MPLFRNYYRCVRCDHEWTDDWSATCDDDCPRCGARHMSPYKSDDIVPPSVERIRALNDAFRKTFTGGKVVMTASVAALPEIVRANALLEVVRFDHFTPDNDPHGEHDFGSFELCGRKFFWKVDLYDPTMEFGSEDPSDPTKTARVLTIMLAEDY